MFTLTRQGLIEGVRFLASPNCEERPENTDISLLVIHNISLPPGQFGSGDIVDFFLNRLDSGRHPYFRTICDLRVSAHLLIDRQGEVIQFVPLQQRAWHAGVSCYEGTENCNDFSIGIELEGCDDEPYTDVQYRLLASISQLLCEHYPALTPERICGHSDIAPGRKTDPGPAFRWDYFRSLLFAGNESGATIV
ncbi:1,6-anhydro-N-acetylmuramyl-L-alanine amidase AmpD [Aestuariirhabdus sp. Z084]|uniref:1,6-anhydro-N-acetylmuramyl-L-alanine amidase AmpD n=1 Tax=Aestuariirhabdus haliotis TaxID=2918751 RepID=UPI00201B3C91|nr:1,6-anhydro-N-acetylmuramyl-L-alanine amidase AmpD [Aestuariirhabdus haliotis]MCL6415982.1 1,6-anhydro-N-acetylmuramyl-L-alanine amidase AmpD [Aestuariirhabdus haliotis]MCL6419985.1 1,6-anhydro-N-acetylmuramyl-L-alanine amidase AmpD [Aestuariirhabdus haliotis]